jgi:hypothetical protein
MGGSLWREDGSFVYNCCWPSPVQSFLGPSPTGLMTSFYCLRFEISFSSPPTTHRATVEVCDTASTRGDFRFFLLITSRYGLHRKHRLQQFFCCCVTQLSHGPRREHRFQVSPLRRDRNMLRSNKRCLQSHYLATGLQLQYELERSWKEAVLA